MNDRFVLIFDFETTGLPKNSWEKYEIVTTYSTSKGIFVNPSNEKDFPYAVQLSYILYDNLLHKSKIVDEIIRLPEGVEITPESLAIHNISLAMTQGKNRKVKNIRTGRFRMKYHLTIDEVLLQFMKDFEKAEVIVSHNILFDKNMLLVEMDRLRKLPEKKYSVFEKYISEIYYNKKEFCTAIHGKNTCKILSINKLGREYYKMPKLSFLYEYLFKETPDESKLHNALYDVLLCMRCFYKMKYDLDITEHDEKIKNLLN
jgi:DNA polymerase-3 subunit alpha